MKKRIKKILKWIVWSIVLGITILILGIFVLYSWLCLAPSYIDYDLSVFDESGQPVAHATLIQHQDTTWNIFGDIFPGAYTIKEQTDANGKFKGRIWILGRDEPEVFIEKSGFLRTQIFQQAVGDAVIGRTVLFPSSYHLKKTYWDESRLTAPDTSLSIPYVQDSCWNDGVFRYMDKLTDGKLSIPELLKRISELPEEEKTRLVRQALQHWEDIPESKAPEDRESKKE